MNPWCVWVPGSRAGVRRICRRSLVEIRLCCVQFVPFGPGGIRNVSNRLRNRNEGCPTEDEKLARYCAVTVLKLNGSRPHPLRRLSRPFAEKLNKCTAASSDGDAFHPHRPLDKARGGFPLIARRLKVTLPTPCSQSPLSALSHLPSPPPTHTFGRFLPARDSLCRRLCT